MAASGFTPISLYYSTTASAVPTSGNLANGELGLNIADMKLYAKNSAGTVTLLASNAGASGSVTSVSGTGTVNGLTLTGTVTTSGSLTLGGTLSGTASININGTVGATTANTGAFTTLTSTGSYIQTSSEANVSLTTSGQKSYALISGGGGNVTNGFFAIRNNTNSNNPFYIDPSAPANCVYISSTGLVVTGSISSTTGATFATSSGNVGIGTSSPAQKLHTNIASGSIYNQISSGVNNVYIGYNSATSLSVIESNNSLAFNVGSSYTERFRIGTAGQLGIGGATYGNVGEVLTSGGSGAAPTWAAAAGGGSQAFVAFGSTGGL